MTTKRALFVERELGFKSEYYNGDCVGFTIDGYNIEIGLEQNAHQGHLVGVNVSIRDVSSFYRWFDDIFTLEKEHKWNGANPGNFGVIVCCGIEWYNNKPSEDSLANFRSDIMQSIKREITIEKNTKKRENKEIFALRGEIEELKKIIEKMTNSR